VTLDPTLKLTAESAEAPEQGTKIILSFSGGEGRVRGGYRLLKSVEA